MATGSYLTPTYSRSQSEVQGDLHNLSQFDWLEIEELETQLIDFQSSSIWIQKFIETRKKLELTEAKRLTSNISKNTRRSKANFRARVSNAFPAEPAPLPQVEVKKEVEPPKKVQEVEEIRSYFPETWLWEMHKIGADGQTVLKRQLPHTITQWVGGAVCVHPKTGLGVWEDSSVTAFQPFFVSFNLPYSVVRGEVLPLTVSVFNYLSECLPAEGFPKEDVFNYFVCPKSYQRELNYRHKDGSYSAFGSSDSEGSLWLTAFVVKSFGQARRFIDVDEKDLALSTSWLLEKQFENGCFEPTGRVLHKEMKVSVSILNDVFRSYLVVFAKVGVNS
ncbi:pregnancy zone protein [Trichonephila clavipes]|nr:pregnancy zone protein [Trichonephila clavipes]